MIWSVEVLVWEFLDFQTPSAVSGSSTRPCVPEARPCVLFSAWDTAVHAARVRLKTQTHARVLSPPIPHARVAEHGKKKKKMADTRPCARVHTLVCLAQFA